MKGFAKYIWLLAAAIVVLLCVRGLKWMADNKWSNLQQDKELYIYPSTPVQEVLDSLSACVKRKGSLERTFRDKQVEKYLTPGHYSFREGATSVFIARSLNNGWQSPVNLTLSGSLRLKGDIARKIAAQMMVDSSQVASALEDEALLSKLGFTPSTVFALFIPDTYEMFWTASVEEILETQKAAYDNFWTKEKLDRAAALGLDKLQVSILASIVKGESRMKSDFPKIAGVYLNRIHKGMLLQADPTVAFCFDYTLDRILLKHLSVDSPYNTYKYKGLPPGPICVPDKDYLEAVLDPDYGGGNLFFCADPSFDGSHRFASTFAEHRQNAIAFQKALNARAKNARVKDSKQ